MELPSPLVEIRKRDLRSFFTDLREQEHYMYAILTKSPQSVFCIVKDSDDWNEPETAYSIREFLAFLGSFHNKKDSFRTKTNRNLIRRRNPRRIGFI